MLIDRPEITETSQLINATVASGTSNPANPDVGELFYRTDLNQLVVFSGGSWVEAGSTGLGVHIADAALHLTSAQNTLLDGLAATLTSTELNFVDGVTSPIQTQFSTLTTNLSNEVSRATAAEAGLQGQITSNSGSFSSHATDATLHLTSAQNTLLDGLAVSLTAAELNFVDGVTSPIQPQINTLSVDLATHIVDDGRHMTTSQNNLLDGLNATLSSTELNYVDGVTAPLQPQLDGRLRLDGGNTMGGNLQLGGNRITGLGTPVASTDAATKDYVDTYVQGLAWKQSVVAATVADITLSGLQTINGVAVVTNDRVLVKNQTLPAQNGIYLVSSSAWSRAPDANTSEELDGAAVFVRGGTVDADSAWIQVNTIPSLGSSLVSWSRFAASSGVTAGVGISLSNAVVSIDAGQGLTFSGNTLVTNLNTATDFAYSSGQINLSTIAGLTAASYGSGTQVPVVTVNTKGRVTAISTVSIPAGQAPDADLTAIAAIPDGQFGLVTRTGNGTATVRSIAAGGTGVTVSQADGVAGNPIINFNDTSSPIGSRLVSRDAGGNVGFNQVQGSNFHDITGTYNVNLGSGGVEGRGVVAGYSGGNYGGIGYNVRFTTTSGQVIAPIADTASLLSFSSGGMVLNGFATGSAGRTLTLGSGIFSVSQGGNISWSGVATGNGSAITGLTYGQIGGTVPVGGLSGTYNINITGSAASALTASASSRSHSLSFFDGTSPLTSTSQQSVSGARGVDQAPNTFTQGIFADFKNSGLYGAAGNYSGLVTVAPWVSTTASTGDVSYQFLFSPASTNSIAAPTLRFRAGIDASWGGWSVVLHSSNFNSYAPTLAGGGANGTWGINITGNSATVAGLGVTASATGNTVAARDGSGYLYSVYFNQASPNTENPTISQVMVTNGADNFLRKASIGHLTASLSGTAPINITGSAGSVSFGNVVNRPVASDWPSLGAPFVAGLLGWKNYGGNHVIFDASQGTAPNGASISNSTPQNVWTNTYPTLMGWNGANTYGVRVDVSARSDFATIAGKASTLAQNGGDGSAMTFNWQGQGGQPTWLWGSNDGISHFVYNPSNFSVNYANTAGSASTAGSATTAGSASTAGFATNAGNSATTSQTVFSTLTVLSEQNTSFDGSTGGLIVEASSASGPATLSFHRPGAYGLNMGLDTDNIFRIAGWSAADDLFRLDMSGNLTVKANVTAYSDRRLKKDVQRIEGALDKVQGLVGVTFRRIDTDERATGVIAQDVQQVLPEAVLTDERGMLSVAYGNMVGLLIEAIKELRQEVEDIKSRLA